MSLPTFILPTSQHGTDRKTTKLGLEGEVNRVLSETYDDIALKMDASESVNFATASHNHAQADITNLVSDLAGKAPTSHTHNASDINAGTLNADRLPTNTKELASLAFSAGDILYHDGTNLQKLAKGTDDQVLAVKAGLLSWENAASFAGYLEYQDVATLLANTSLAYGPGAQQVAAGDVIRTRAEGFAYEVAETSATDHHVTTTGGVKMKVLPFTVGADGGLYLVEAFGADGVTDDTAAIQAALSAAGTFTSPPLDDDIYAGINHNIGQGTVVCFAGGRHVISSALNIPPGVTLDLNGSMLVQTDPAESGVVLSYANTTGGGYGLFGATLKNGLILGPGKDTSSARGVFCEVLNRSQIRNITVSGFKFGVALHESQYNTFDTIHVTSCKVGWYVTARPTMTNLASIDNNYINLEVNFCYYGMWLQTSSHSLFERIDSSRNEVVDVLIGSQLVGYISEYTVTSGGSGYGASTTVPVTITGGGGSMAQAYAITNASGEVVSVVGVDAGDGYTSPPTVTIGGSGSGATATATVEDDTGLGDFDGVPSEVRGHNVFVGLKVEHNTDDLPKSGYAVIINNTTCRRNVFEHPALTRQISGSGPTAYMRLMRSGGFGTIVNYPQDTQNASFSSITNPANSGDFSIFRAVASQGLGIEWGPYQNGDDAIKCVVNAAGPVVESGSVFQRGYDAAGYTQAVGYVAKNSWSGTAAFRGQVFNEAHPRITLTTGGELRFGDGSSAHDVTLGRVNSNTLALGAGDGLGVGNSTANTNTPSGGTARQWPLYDETGALLGYVPVYGSPW